MAAGFFASLAGAARAARSAAPSIGQVEVDSRSVELAVAHGLLDCRQRGAARQRARMEVTKSGKRREVPMRDAVYKILAAMPEPRTGLVWPEGYNRKAFKSAVEAAKLDARFR